MALVFLKSINGNTDITFNINHNFLNNLSECSAWNVQTIAKNLKDANLSGTCVIVTKEITFYLNEKPTSVLNEEYMFMQKIIANGASACAPLGINFHITEKTKYEREYGFPYKKTRKLSVFTITLKNIDLTNIQAYAENFHLTPGQITDAVRVAAYQSEPSPIVNSDFIIGAVKQQMRHRLSEHATLLEKNYRWEDLIVTKDVETQLREIVYRYQYRRF